MNLTLTANKTAFYEIKKSRFIAYLEPYSSNDSFNRRRQQLTIDHPKANHVCYAWRNLSNQQIQEGFSDDGEPSGTVGIPLLKLLQQHSMIATQLFVVRYFGGTKLGTGGLMRSYTEAAKMCIDETFREGQYITFQIQSTASASASFSSEQYLRLLCEQHSIRVNQPSYSDNGLIANLVAPRTALENLAKSLCDHQEIALGEIADV